MDNLPSGPMLLNEVDERLREKLIRDDAYLLQPKFDGDRLWLTATEEYEVTGRSRAGNLRTQTTKGKPLPATVIQCARAWVSANRQPFVIDGELVGDTFICFDVLSVDGRPLWQDQAAFRAGYVQAMWRHSSTGIVGSATAATGDEKEDLYRACYANGLEGVVLKRKDKSYTPGRPDVGGPNLKVKFWNTGEVLSGGQRQEKSKRTGELKRSVSLLLADGVHVGSVTIPPNKPIPPRGTVISVRYLYRGAEDGHLVQAVYLGVRDDILPAACTAGQLRVKGAKRRT